MDRRSFVKAVSAGVAGPAFFGLEASGRGLRTVYPSDQINVGVIGVGSRGQWMMRHLLRVPGVRITALCDIYEPRFLEGQAITDADTPTYKDYRRMLDDAPDLDAVLVASPLAKHGEHVVASLERGLHIYGEKSMAYTLEDANRIVAAVRQSGKHFQIGHQYRYAPWYHEAIARIKEGEIGRVTHIFGYWHRNNNWRRPVPDPSLEKLINWRLYLESSRGLLAELGSHHIDVANWVFEELPVSVIGNGGIEFYNDGRETYDHVQAIFKYPSGGTLVFSSLLGNHRMGYQLWIVGTGGNVELTRADATFYYEPARDNSAVPGDLEGVHASATLGAQGDMPYRGTGEKVTVPEGEAGDQDYQAVLSFAKALREDKRPFADEHVGWGSAVPVAFGHQAIRENRRVPFGEPVEVFMSQDQQPLKR
jgi:predicted dehydrogenase